MSPGLTDLLTFIRQHPCFDELLSVVQPTPVKAFRPTKGVSIEDQQADWIFRSGRNAQHEIWLAFLKEYAPNGAEFGSQKESS